MFCVEYVLEVVNRTCSLDIGLHQRPKGQCMRPYDTSVKGLKVLFCGDRFASSASQTEALVAHGRIH
jgi:hypothetical protein